MKIVKSFPEVELYWLLNGKGSFPPSEKPEKQLEESKVSDSSKLQNLPTSEEEKQTPAFLPKGQQKPISKIVIFYEDGTFEAFQN
jgi:hypothetical protein